MARIMQRQLAQFILAFILAGALSDLALAENIIGAHHEMLRSARMWEAKDRPDLARTMLEKALLTKEDPEVLLLLTCLELRSNNTKFAAQYLLQLEQHYPQHPNIVALRSLYRVYTTEKQTLARVRLMARSGKLDEAAKAMLQLFPEGPPPEELGLEYYQIVGNVSQGEKSAMTALARRYKETGEARYRLAWLKLRGSQGNLQENLRDYETLAARADVNRNKLREDWWLILKSLSMSPASLIRVSHFLKEFSNDHKAISFMADLQQSKELIGDQKIASKQVNLKKSKNEPPLIINDPAMQSRHAGLTFLEQGQYFDAERELQKSLLLRPNDSEVLGGIGLLRLRQGVQDEALTWFQRAASIESDSNKWSSLIRTASFWSKMKRADGLLEAGNVTEAQLTAEQALAIDPHNADTLALLGNISALNSNQKEAERFYHLALKQNGSSASAMRGLLSLLSRSERHSEALALIADFRIKNPQQADQFSETQARVLRDEADLYLSAHRPVHALQALETAVLLAPTDAWIRYDLANLYESLYLPAIGHRVMADGAKLAPNDEGMNYAYALVLSAQGSEAEAISRLSRIPLSTRTDGMNALETRLWIKRYVQNAKQLFSEGRLEEATHEMTLAQARSADQQNAIESVAEGWFSLGQQTRSLALMKQSLDETKTATPNSHIYYANLLNRAKQDDALSAFLHLLYQRNDWDEKQLDALLEIETDASVRQIERLLKQEQHAKAQAIAAQMPVFGKAGELVTMKSQARLKMKVNDMKTAIPLLETILDKQPNDNEARLDLARAYYLEGSKQAAQNTISQLLARLQENDIDTRLSVARLEMRFGHIAEARQLVTALLARYPSNAEVLMQAGYIEQADRRYDASLAYFRRVKAQGAQLSVQEHAYNTTP